MARSLRIEYPGASYHVMNRGNFRQLVFDHTIDYQTFVEKLAKFSPLFSVRILSYCLMPNHFHLYLRTEESNLSKFMQSLLTSYTVTSNRRHRRNGHLFQGRFKALLVEDEGYGSSVSRYIHLNPVMIPTLSDVGVEQKLDRLLTYPWSSYPAIIGLRKCPKWLDRRSTLKRWGKGLKEQRKNYAGFVTTGLARGVEDPYEAAAARGILGSDRFINSMRRGLVDLSDKLAIKRECGQQAQLLSWVDLDDLVGIVAEVYQTSKETLLTRHSRGNEGRQVLLYLAAKHCRGRYSLTEIGQRLGPISLGALSGAKSRMEARLTDDKQLSRRVKEIEKRLK